MFYFRRCVALAALLLYCLICIATRSHPGRIKDAVDSVLDNKISDLLLSIPRKAHTDDLQRILQLQLYLSCLIKKGKWSIGSHPWPSFSFGKTCSSSNVHPKFNLAASLDICRFISGKRILFVGPETTFYLHSLWLASLETHESRSLTCLGHEFCTFHHICRPPGNTGELLPDELLGRKKKIPSKNTLVASKSSLLQYSLSSTLYASQNKHDKAYTEPILDEQTGIRVSNSYWLRRARQADLIVMNRGPLPAPATTYAFSSESFGNWTFATTLCAQNNRLGSTSCNATLDLRLVNAAFDVTVNHFLPSLFRSLDIMTRDNEIAKSSLVWQGSWYMQPACAMAPLPSSVPLLQDMWSTENGGLVDPWTFYYNAQVYMHDRLLPQILPHFNITYVPLTIPGYVRPHLRFLDHPDFSAKHPKDCLRRPWPTFGADSLEVGFFNGLKSVLQSHPGD